MILVDNIRKKNVQLAIQKQILLNTNHFDKGLASDNNFHVVSRVTADQDQASFLGRSGYVLRVNL